VLHVPEDKLVAFVIDLGYPADRPLRPGTRLKRRRLMGRSPQPLMSQSNQRFCVS